MMADQPFRNERNQWFPEALIIFFVLVFVGCLGGLVVAWLAHELANGAIF